MVSHAREKDRRDVLKSRHRVAGSLLSCYGQRGAEGRGGGGQKAVCMDREGKRPAVPEMWKATWEVYRGI